MALPNDSFAVTPSGSGALIATHLISGKEYMVNMPADHDGHIEGSLPAYYLYQTPRVTTAAATDFFDIFNATGSGKIIRIRGIYPVTQVTAANTLVPTFEFQVIRTSAVGTAGTAHTYGGAAAGAAGIVNIAPVDSTNAALPAQITSRSLPTGGATAAQFLFSVWLITEETNPATTLVQGINMVPVFPFEQPVELQESQGLKIRQITATASTGVNFGWLVAFVVV
jgi:hypothetical protein